MCMTDDGDPVTVLHERHPIAAKPHKCNECRRTIDRGESYMVERYVFEGEAHTHKTCLHCQIARDWLTLECGGFIYTMIDEDIQEHSREGYGFGVARLAAGLACGWRRKNGALYRIPPRPITTDERMRASVETQTPKGEQR